MRGRCGTEEEGLCSAWEVAGGRNASGMGGLRVAPVLYVASQNEFSKRQNDT